MATIRWCPIYPKWDIYQSLSVPISWGKIFRWGKIQQLCIPFMWPSLSDLRCRRWNKTEQDGTRVLSCLARKGLASANLLPGFDNRSKEFLFVMFFFLIKSWTGRSSKSVLCFWTLLREASGGDRGGLRSPFAQPDGVPMGQALKIPGCPPMTFARDFLPKWFAGRRDRF